MSKTIGSKTRLKDLLSKEQTKLLTPKAANLTKSEVDGLLNRRRAPKISDKDKVSLRTLALHRINNGQTVMTYSHHKIKHTKGHDQDPNTCSTF